MTRKENCYLILSNKWNGIVSLVHKKMHFFVNRKDGKSFWNKENLDDRQICATTNVKPEFDSTMAEGSA